MFVKDSLPERIGKNMSKIVVCHSNGLPKKSIKSGNSGSEKRSKRSLTCSRAPSSTLKYLFIQLSFWAHSWNHLNIGKSVAHGNPRVTISALQTEPRTGEFQLGPPVESLE